MTEANNGDNGEKGDELRQKRKEGGKREKIRNNNGKRQHN